MTDYGYDLGNYTRPITTTVEAAQTWFDRGLNWTYGFNHPEAIASFQRALEADPDCAMAYWGIAYASGPNYNMPWSVYDPRGRAKALGQAYDATQEAMARLEGLAAGERALIEALPARYPQREISDDMDSWDRAFADRMRQIHEAHPSDLDLRSVFVESLLNLTPWKMWDLRSGAPAAGAATVEAQTVLEAVLDTGGAAMSHPGLLHLYVHLMEMSPFPEKALKAGDVLRTLVPDAGHLVHMPTHIDVLCGDYEKVVRWNQRAVVADLAYYEREGPFNVYTGYRQHNYHFIVYGALFLGQIEPALAAVRGMAETVPDDMLAMESPPMADFYESYMALEPHILVRFGRWQDLIEMAPPEKPEIYRTLAANTHYARAIAFAALGRVAEAEAEERVFLEACDAVPPTRLMHNNTVADLLAVAKEMVRGEIEYRKENFEPAYAHLRRAIELEDNLPYDEPWGWMQPVRHALGALLLEQGHVRQAEAVYREDLGLGGQLSRATVHPRNVWSLRGLHECLERRGETVEIQHIKQQLDVALARADGTLGASCFCAQAAMNPVS